MDIVYFSDEFQRSEVQLEDCGIDGDVSCFRREKNWKTAAWMVTFQICFREREKDVYYSRTWKSGGKV